MQSNGDSEESIFDLKVDAFGFETTLTNIVAIFCGLVVSLCILFCAAHYGIKMGFKTTKRLLEEYNATNEQKQEEESERREEKQTLIRQHIVVITS